MKIRLNWPLVVLVLGGLGMIGGTLLALMLTHIVSVDALKAFGIFVFGVASGGSIPVATWWKEKRITVDLDSDPPSPLNGEKSHADQ